MTSRTRLLITATLLCHLLVAHSLVTSQLLSSGTDSQELPNTPSMARQEDVTIIALQQEKQGSIYQLHGNAEIRYSTYILRADEMTYNADTGEATADGHVTLDGGINDEHVRARHAIYNIRSESGRFENATGSIGAQLQGRHLALTSPNPFFFTGKVVEKTAPDHYKVIDGTVTTCELPSPKWQFKARKVIVEVGGTAKIYHSNFDIRNIPILYLPFATLPAERLPRQTGFLIPDFGTSSIKGTILGESFFWAINRSVDAHIAADYFSKRGWAPQGEFRARPSDTSFVDATYFSVLDRGIGNPPLKEGGEELRVIAQSQFWDNFRAVASVDYLSSFLFRAAFSEVFTQAVDSEVKSDGFLSKAANGFFYDFAIHRYQDFESTTPGDAITILHAPEVELWSADHPLGPSPFYWSFDASAEGLSRSEPGFSTGALVGRFDLNPNLSLPLHLGGWSFLPELSLRNTSYTQELETVNGTRDAVSNYVNRKLLQASVKIRPPALERVFGREFLGRKWKHVLEPHVTYNYVTGVNNFNQILRFDYLDILNNTNEVEYGIVNRLYAKRTRKQAETCGQPGMPLLFIGGVPPHNVIPWLRQNVPTDVTCDQGPEVREILTWELVQKYFGDPTFGGALVPGRSNVLASTADLTGIAFLSQPHHLSPLISRLRLQASTRTDIEWDVDYDFNLGQMNASTVLLNYRIGPITIGGGDALLRVPPESPNPSTVPVSQSFNQYRLLLGYGHTGKRGFSAATNIGFDADLNFLQYAAVQATYNWDCCGINLEFRRFDLGTVRNENEYRFTFALANLGALGNLRKNERLF